MNLVVFCCHHAMYGGLEPGEVSRVQAPGAHNLEVPCAGKVELIYLLKAFENGADGVIILSCEPQICDTVEGSARQVKRVARTRVLLAEAGIEPERLILIQVKRPAHTQMKQLVADAEKIISALGPSPLCSQPKAAKASKTSKTSKKTKK